MNVCPAQFAPAHPLPDGIAQRLLAGLAMLRDASIYACDTGQSAWDFAVAIGELAAAGVAPNDLRWLLTSCYVDQAAETTAPGDTARRFEPRSGLVLAERACFVLTAAGLRFVESVLGGREGREAAAGSPVVPLSAAAASEEDRPQWDSRRRTLSIGGCVVKQFRRPSPNQETVLAAFEEEHWPRWVADPLPPRRDIKPKQRLHDTIKALNRCHLAQRIRFRGDGTGEGIFW